MYWNELHNTDDIRIPPHAYSEGALLWGSKIVDGCFSTLDSECG